jgi:hypothetical protein
MAKNLAIISREFFYFFSLLYFVSIGLEIIWPNIVLVYLNLNYLFLLALISGLVSLIKR